MVISAMKRMKCSEILRGMYVCWYKCAGGTSGPLEIIGKEGLSEEGSTALGQIRRVQPWEDLEKNKYSRQRNQQGQRA